MLFGGKVLRFLGCGVFTAGLLILAQPETAEARPQYFKVFEQKYPQLKEEAKEQKCNVCHFGKNKKNRSNYGEAFGKILNSKNEKDVEKIKAALEKVEKEKSAVKDKTFGDLIKDGKLPATGWEPPKEN